MLIVALTGFYAFIIFFTDEVQKHTFSLFPIFLSLAAWSICLLVVGPPSFLGYYPAWVTRIVPTDIVEALIKVVQKIHNDSKQANRTHPRRHTLSIFIVFLLLVMVLGFLSALRN